MKRKKMIQTQIAEMRNYKKKRHHVMWLKYVSLNFISHCSKNFLIFINTTCN